MNRFCCVAVIASLVVYLCLLVQATAVNSPVMSEDALLVSGVSHYKYSRFDLYRVNPPLVRLCAAYPVIEVLSESKDGWWRYDVNPLKRSEFFVGVDFAKTRPDYSNLIFKARQWVAIPFGLLVVVVCFTWSRSLLGPIAGFFSLLFWCFNPYILGHSLTIMNDVPAAAVGVAVVFIFVYWLRAGKVIDAFLTGIVLGLAELTKFTLLVFYPLFLVLWLLYKFPEYKSLTKNGWFQQAKQLIAMFAISILIINMGYLFEGTGKQLGTFKFQTTSLTGCEKLEDIPRTGGNRFEGTLLGYLPMPLPSNYIQGIDTQRLDFERGLPSYLRGEWSDHGWWYYYFYALLIKTPLGTIGLFLLAIFCTFFQKGYNVAWRDEMVILLPGVVLLIFVSSQTGFSVHSRYIIPALPFFLIWMSKVGKAFTLKRPIVATLATILITWSIASSLWVYPHSISYFNELATVLPTPEGKNYPKAIESPKTFWQKTKYVLNAGPRNGPRHLLDSNIDWGQDLFNLERWCKAHPEADEMKVAYWGSYPLELTTISSKGMPSANDPQPGWFALSVNYLYDRSQQYRYFLNYEPIATAGYSIYIYHVTPAEANRVRHEMGLPELDGEVAHE